MLCDRCDQPMTYGEYEGIGAPAHHLAPDGSYDESRDEDHTAFNSAWEEADPKARALAVLLSVDVSTIDVGSYALDVNQHTVKDGLSPEQAKADVAFLRKALRIVRGPTTDTWTTGFLALEGQLAAAQQASLEDVTREVRRAYEVKWTSEHWSAAHDTARYVEWEGKRRMFDWMGEEQQKAYLKVKAKELALAADPTHQRLVARLAELRIELAKRATYNNLAKEFQANPTTEPMLREGVHPVLNTLYHLSPEAANYELRYSTNLSPHVLTLREAFDGQEPVDRRTERVANDGEYKVLTEAEANEAWLEELNYYLVECVLPDLPEQSRKYFDRARWIEDAKTDGRGHALSGYDGKEVVATDPVTGEQFFVYRHN